MKKILMRLALPLLVLIGVISTLPADEIFVGEVSYLDVEMAIQDSFNIKYETEYNEMYIQTHDWHGTAWITLNNDQIETLRNTVSKALDWCNIAHENKSSLKKELPNSTLESDVLWEFGDDAYSNSSYDKLRLQFHFLSVDDGHGGIVPSLAILAPSITSSRNEYVTYSFPQVIIFENELKSFNEVISEDSINKAVEKHEESKKAEDLFN